MKVFYNFLMVNSKLIICFIFIAGAHIYLISNLQKKAKTVEGIQDLREIHKVVQDKISINLLEVCDIFQRNNSKQLSIKKYLSQFKLDYHLVKSKIVRFEDLTFYQILFKSYKIENQEISTTSIGYLVENKKTSKCFGLL